MKPQLTDMKKAVRDAIPADCLPPIWVAFSGGLDSTLLLKLAADELGADRVCAVHVDHQLHVDSSKWREHCTQVAKKLAVGFECELVDVDSGNLELEARRSRYRVLEQHVGLGEVVLMAHHKDDLVETRLWQLLTGRMPIGIPESRRIGQGQIVRPLLAWSRHELEQVACDEELDWIDDPGNADTSYDRNWLRHLALPMLEGRFPGAADAIAAFDPGVLQEVVAQPLHLRREEPIDRSTVRSWLHAYGLYPPQSTVDEVCRQAVSARQDSRMSVKVGAKATVRRYDMQLHVVPMDEVPQETWITVGEELRLPNGVLVWKKSDSGFVAGERLGLVARRDLEGRGLSALKVNGQSKRLKNIFQEHRIPYWQRPGWPVLYSHKKILALPSLAATDSSRSSNHDRGETYLPEWSPTSY